MIEFHSSPEVLKWIARHFDPDADETYFKDSTALGILRDRKPICGVAYSKRELAHGNDMMLSIAAAPQSRWATPQTLRVIFGYPFVQHGCARVTALCAENNTRSIDMVKRMGFRREGVIRRGWNGKTNGILFGMLREECRYIV